MKEHKSDFELTINTPYLALMGELWGVYCEDFEKSHCYIYGIALYLLRHPIHVWSELVLIMPTFMCQKFSNLVIDFTSKNEIYLIYHMIYSSTEMQVLH